ncbi:reverse transcriptase [Plakobranchus ocellatus]|uniref:Reverse transcriptase n=1 Tax=Plakobranchus ocellatus TaxID=259542 RepID=A0AAV4B712_9GAST|nr:reverse transcriptase [Plakobranchus ocellatus]
MEEGHAFKEAKYLDLTKELKKGGCEAKVMPVEIGARGFVSCSAYRLLSKLSISGNKRTKALRLLAGFEFLASNPGAKKKSVAGRHLGVPLSVRRYRAETLAMRTLKTPCYLAPKEFLTTPSNFQDLAATS